MSVLLILLYFVLVLIAFLFPPKSTHNKRIPLRIERKAIRSDKILVVAHRGSSLEYLENTMTAFRNAVRQGANILQMDVLLTCDKQLVVFHDDNLLRLCGINKNIADIDYKDLPPLKRSK
jgi:glycerophosphoryl diester phosphodiesterase